MDEGFDIGDMFISEMIEIVLMMIFGDFYD